MHALSLVTAATTDPITLEEVKEALRIDHSDEDPWLKSLISAATRYVERVSSRQLINATYRLSLDSFPDFEIRLPKPPLSSITTVAYVNTAGSSTTVSSTAYDVDTYSEPGRLTPSFNDTWPATRNEINAVNITYVAGYGAAASNVPATTKHALKLLIAHWNENREAVLTGVASKEVEFAVNALLGSEEYGSYS